MELVNAEIRVPKGMFMYVKPEDKALELERNALMLYPYIKNRTISHGKAAEILGIHKWDLIELYASVGIPYFDQDIEEIKSEIDSYNQLQGEEA